MPASTRRNGFRQRLYPGSDRSEMRALTMATPAPFSLAARKKFGQNSVSATTTSFGRSARIQRRDANAKSSGK